MVDALPPFGLMRNCTIGGLGIARIQMIRIQGRGLLRLSGLGLPMVSPWLTRPRIIGRERRAGQGCPTRCGQLSAPGEPGRALRIVTAGIGPRCCRPSSRTSRSGCGAEAQQAQAQQMQASQVDTFSRAQATCLQVRGYSVN